MGLAAAPYKSPRLCVKLPCRSARQLGARRRPRTGILGPIDDGLETRQIYLRSHMHTPCILPLYLYSGGSQNWHCHIRRIDAPRRLQGGEALAISQGGGHWSMIKTKPGPRCCAAARFPAFPPSVCFASKFSLVGLNESVSSIRVENWTLSRYIMSEAQTRISIGIARLTRTRDSRSLLSGTSELLRDAFYKLAFY